jgi:nitrogen regulatory protein PII
MKMVMIVLNASIEEEVRGCAKEYGLSEYTKFTKVLGEGENSGPHMGTHIWPSVNTVILYACEEEKANRFVDHLAKIKDEFRELGLKAFVFDLDRVL